MIKRSYLIGVLIIGTCVYSPVSAQYLGCVQSAAGMSLKVEPHTVGSPMITTITITSVTTRNKLEFVDTLFFQGSQTIPNLTISRNAKRLILHAAAQRGSDGARLTVTTSNGDTSTEVMPTAIVMFDVDCQTFPPTLSEPTTETTDEFSEKNLKTFEGFSPHLSATVSLSRERRQIQSRSTSTGFYSRNR